MQRRKRVWVVDGCASSVSLATIASTPNVTKAN